MIAAKLIVGTAVGGAEIEALVAGAVGLDTECDADESAGGVGRSRSRGAGYVDFDGSILKIGPG